MAEENLLLKEFKNKYAKKAGVIIALVFIFSLAGILGTFLVYHYHKDTSDKISIASKQRFLSALILLDLKKYISNPKNHEVLHSLEAERHLFRKGLQIFEMNEPTSIVGVKNSSFATYETPDKVDIFKETLSLHNESDPELFDLEKKVASLEQQQRHIVGPAWDTYTKQRSIRIDQIYLAMMILVALCFGAAVSLIVFAYATIIHPLMKAINLILKDNEKIEQENHENQMLLKYSSKFVSLGENIVNINHDMNNIVAVMNTFIFSFKRLIKDQPELSARFATLDKSVERLNALTSALRRSILVNENMNEEIFRVIDIIKDCEIILSDKLKKENVRLELEIDQRLTVSMRKDYLYQLILNLVSNSVDALSGTEDAWVKIKAFDSDGELFIRVTDAGFGLSLDVQEKLFTPFYTTKKTGSGLGLNYAKKMIETVGGEIYYEDKHINTCFTLKIPKKNAAPLTSVA